MARLAREGHIQTVIDTWVNSESLPGIIFGIFDENDEELFYYAKDDGKQKYEKSSLFRIYSMTKPIASVAILLLMERGLLSLDDEISKWIPAFANSKVCVGGTVEAPILEDLKEPIRIWHLLSHTSGITYAIFAPNNISDQIIRQKCSDWPTWFSQTDLPTLCQLIAETPLCFQPGSKYHYGLSTDVIGYLIEMISHQTLEEFFQTQIFQPLGMKDTTFQVPIDQLHRLVTCYEVGLGQTYIPSTNPERNRDSQPLGYKAGGGLVSTIIDYSKFTGMLLRRGKLLNGNNFLQTSSIDLLSQNRLFHNSDIYSNSYERGFSESIGPGYGFGLNVSILLNSSLARGGKCSPIGEYGWGGVAGTSFLIDNVHQRTVIFFTQMIGLAAVYPIRQQFRYLSHWLFDDEPTATVVSVSDHNTTAVATSTITDDNTDTTTTGEKV
jgi:CubicO group peptidase (beta-lactamase class C family)